MLDKIRMICGVLVEFGLRALHLGLALGVGVILAAAVAVPVVNIALFAAGSALCRDLRKVRVVCGVFCKLYGVGRYLGLALGIRKQLAADKTSVMLFKSHLGTGRHRRIDVNDLGVGVEHRNSAFRNRGLVLCFLVDVASSADGAAVVRKVALSCTGRLGCGDEAERMLVARLCVDVQHRNAAEGQILGNGHYNYGFLIVHRTAHTQSVGLLAHVCESQRLALAELCRLDLVDRSAQVLIVKIVNIHLVGIEPKVLEIRTVRIRRRYGEGRRLTGVYGDILRLRGNRAVADGSGVIYRNCRSRHKAEDQHKRQHEAKNAFFHLIRLLR